MTQYLSGFAPLADRYDGFVLDLWGVIHDGVNAFPHALECLDHLRRAGKRSVLLSNAPRPNDSVRTLMRQLGISDHLYSDMLTSGEAVRRALISPPSEWWTRLGHRVFHLGPDRDRPILDGLPFDLVGDPADADFVLNTGPDDHLDPTDISSFEAVLANCAWSRLPMVCANPDLEVIRGGVRVLCAGALAVRYRELGGDVRALGKPDATIYECALSMLGMTRSRTLAVGDSLRTDIAGATAAGIASCWVLGGLHWSSLLDSSSSIDLARVRAAIHAAAVQPPVACIARFDW